MKIEHFDLISPEPIYINKVGRIISPKLKDIYKIGYNTYNMYLNCFGMTPDKYFELIDQKETYKKLSEQEKSDIDIFDLIIKDESIRELYQKAFDFFMCDTISYYDEFKCFFTFNGTLDDDNELIPTGVIRKDNFKDICSVILQRNYAKTEEVEEEKQVKYKNDFARKLAERMAKANNEKSKGESIPFGKMVSKFCVINKNGINMLNVFELTIYQFYDQLVEHNNLRQCDIQDMIYANSVSFNDIKSYDSQLWFK